MDGRGPLWYLSLQIIPHAGIREDNPIEPMAFKE